MNAEPRIFDQFIDSLDPHLTAIFILECTSRDISAIINTENDGSEDRDIRFIERAVDKNVCICVRRTHGLNQPLAREIFFEFEALLNDGKEIRFTLFAVDTFNFEADLATVFFATEDLASPLPPNETSATALLIADFEALAFTFGALIVLIRSLAIIKLTNLSLNPVRAESRRCWYSQR